MAIDEDDAEAWERAQQVSHRLEVKAPPHEQLCLG